LEHFDRHSNYNEKSSYTSVKFGHDRPLLEVELNELQQIQENARTSMLREAIPSGFTYLVDPNFKGEKMIFRPSANGLILKNQIAIAPFQCVINGYPLVASGNFTYNKIDNYILIDLGNPTEDSTYDSLVYLEVWFESKKGIEDTNKNGYVDGESLGQLAFDDRVNDETSRRITMCWDVRVKNECNFNEYPEGLGYNDILHYSSVFAKANGQFGVEPNVNLVFCEATNELFLEESFNHDKNLYVAGRKDFEIKSTSLFGKYVFALPMFRIRRRNLSKYNFENYNGSDSYNDMLVNNDSSKNGDIKNYFRTDRLAYDVISENDVIDLRKTVSLSGFDYEVLCDNTFKDLINNNLTTNGTPIQRRVQIGNRLFNFGEIGSCKLMIPFDGTINQLIPTYDASRPLVYDAAIKFDNSLNHLGAIIDDNKELSYNVTDLLTEEKGTIDFYMKSNWNGCDDYSQVMLSLVNESNSPIIKLQKLKNKLILSQYNYEISNDNYIENKAIVNLSDKLIISGRYYHIRISWCNEPSPVVGQIYVYINTKLVAQADYSRCYLKAARLKIGDSMNQYSPGFIIDNFVAFNNNYELIMGSGTGYTYVVNKFWPMIPKDFSNYNTLLMPGFNSIVNNYSDNAFTQKDTIFYINKNEEENLATFEINLNEDKYVESITEIYDMDGNKLSNITYGRVEGVGTNHVIFYPYNQDLERVIIQCVVCLSPGCGGIDMPTKINGAAIVKYDMDADTVANYEYPLYIEQEVSFNDINSKYPRKIPYLKPRKVFGNEDEAYDFTNEYRTHSQCYARLIYYNVSGNGTNQYEIPIEVYGYKVLGIVGSHTNRIESITKTPSPIVGEEDLNFKVYLKYPLNIGDTITFELACAGYSFDYDLKSKTIMTNMHKCKLLEFVANGVDNVYTLPCMNMTQDGGIHGGVLKSVYTFINNELNNEAKIVGQEETVLVYHNGEIFYDEHGMPTNKKIYNTMPVRITDDSFGSPFITIIFDEESKPRKDVTIQLPIMVSYQMTNEDLLSIWYEHVPYQGVMTVNNKKVTRVGDWKYFMTTLSTGKPNNEAIQTNIINGLPGGMVYSYKIDNADIILKNVTNDMTTTLNNEDINKKIVFMNDFMLKNNEETCSLSNEYILTKNSNYFQDGNISFENVDFNLYFNDTTTPIKKYIGAYCPVADEKGEIFMFVIGNINTNTSVITKLDPQYGDLYRIKGRPSIKK